MLKREKILGRCWKGIAVSLLLLGTGGCFRSEAPQCSDPQVVRLVEESYAEQVGALQRSNPLAAVFLSMLPKKMVALESPRPVKYEENIRLRSCKAVARFDDNRTADIRYTVQLDERNSDHVYVELKMDFLEGLAQQSIQEEMLKVFMK
jgi:hypothetical protein